MRFCDEHSPTRFGVKYDAETTEGLVKMCDSLRRYLFLTRNYHWVHEAEECVDEYDQAFSVLNALQVNLVRQMGLDDWAIHEDRFDTPIDLETSQGQKI